MSSATDFEIDGTKFRLKPLKVENQLVLLGLIAPALGALKGGGDVAGAVSALSNLPKLFRLFCASCEAMGDGMLDTNKPTYAALEGFADVVFERKPAKLVAFVVQCTSLELGDFLDGNGLALIKAAASRFTSPKA